MFSVVGNSHWSRERTVDWSVVRSTPLPGQRDGAQEEETSQIETQTVCRLFSTSSQDPIKVLVIVLGNGPRVAPTTDRTRVDSVLFHPPNGRRKRPEAATSVIFLRSPRWIVGRRRDVSGEAQVRLWYTKGRTLTCTVTMFPSGKDRSCPERRR